MRLSGRNAIITGANQGLGLAIAKAFINEGASVAICARDEEKLESSAGVLRSVALPGQHVVAAECDVSRESDVANFVQKAADTFGMIHVLVNNAGIYGPMGFLEEIDWDAWVQAISINLFGMALMYRAVVPYMKKNNYGKIINLSGGGATVPLPRISAYASSKAAVVRLTETLAEECRDNRIDVNAVAPGALNTRLLDQVLDAGADAVGTAFFEKAMKQKQSGGEPLEKGASLCVYLASSESDGITGKLISAVWDPWERFDKYRDEIRKTDIYNLRRIVPRDRGLDWDDR